ncbi:DUF5615 family PIN-like protein [Ancylobacter sp. G4_0304]|uniref:DUF5615 family PIN-like protein n=1 Tax=Ancylobacter sp. G4_0304 TaxID=3114289 RepID=UPI0039C6F13E
MTHDVGMRFFIDHCVPESVAKALEKAGREVIRLRTKTAPDSPDTLVAAVAEANNAILVTMDSDFKAIASRTGIGQQRYRRLSLVRFQKCRESHAAHRLISALSLIDHEWEWSAGKKDRRIFVVISSESIRTHR